MHLHRDPGFTAFKMKCTGTSPVWDVAVLRALRAALGDDVKLRWDPNASYPPAQATVLCQQLEELNLEYYEDPIHGIPGMTQLRARMKTPLATNMCVVNFDHLVDRTAPALCRCGAGRPGDVGRHPEHGGTRLT